MVLVCSVDARFPFQYCYVFSFGYLLYIVLMLGLYFHTFDIIVPVISYVAL